MDQLPPPKFPQARQWRFNRKRRRSGTETGESESKLLLFCGSLSNTETRSVL